jgi:hypothetical protein
MRFVFLLGGISGFALAGGTSFAMERSADRVFLDGAVGCLAGALLFRWLWNVLLSGLRETMEARHRASADEAAKRQPETSPLKS